MTHYKLAFVGFGHVARSLVRLLARKQAFLKSHWDLTFSITGISTGRHGCAVEPAGLNVEQALALIESGQSISSLSNARFSAANSLDVIRQSAADVLFENSPVNHASGQPAIDHIRAALEASMHAITANKGAVVHAYRDLTQLAKSKNRKFFFEATVLGGTPVFSVFREALPAATLLSFKGIINSTTNIILTRMENGEMFDQAVKYCQSIGIAETDPSADVDGWDAAIKVAALITVLMETPFRPQQVDRTGIRGLTADLIAQAKADGKRWKLVASADRSSGAIQARVAPELVDSTSPLYGMLGSTAGLEFRTDVLGDLAIIESDREGIVAGPDTTAYALLADFINAVKS